MAPHMESPPPGLYGYSGISSTASTPMGDLSDAQLANLLRRAGFADNAPRPNILYIMADQMSAPLLKMHDKDSPIKTPHLDKLAEKAVVFDNAYCNSPLCAPSRFCMVSGQLPSKIKAYDNASTLPSDIPTYAHYLRKEGYETVLAGKMHFIGPDQLHGYENRLTPDIYPGDFGWSVNWDKPDERQEWYHNMSSVLQAGPCVRSNQLDFDEEVMYKSTQYLYDYVRQRPEEMRPFCMTVSLTHPHDPYAITEDYWDRYADVEIPLPKVSVAQEDQDPHSKRLIKAIDLWGKHMPKEAIKRARRAYYGACSYVDDQIGRLVKTLKQCKLEDNTIIIFSGDHGDMLGEKSMWYKMSWFEHSARVPFLVHCPDRFAPKRVSQPVSTLDILPTMVDLIGSNLCNHLPIDGNSLYEAICGRDKTGKTVYGEYMGEGTISPVMMIRRQTYKYTTALCDPPQLFDLATDPHEIHNLCTSDDPKHKELVATFAKEAAEKWDLQKIHDDVLFSQRQRLLCWDALQKGKWASWDFAVDENSTGKYIRSKTPLDDLELRARFPVVDALGRESKRATHHGVAGAAGERDRLHAQEQHELVKKKLGLQASGAATRRDAPVYVG